MQIRSGLCRVRMISVSSCIFCEKRLTFELDGMQTLEQPCMHSLDIQDLSIVVNSQTLASLAEMKWASSSFGTFYLWISHSNANLPNIDHSLKIKRDILHDALALSQDEVTSSTLFFFTIIHNDFNQSITSITNTS